MAAGTHHLTIDQGATWSQTFVWKSAGSPVNVTGYVARLQARPSASSDIKWIDLSSATGGITLGGAAGTITPLLSAAQTAELNFASAVYDLEVESASGVVTRLAQGTITLSREVTR